MPLTKILRSAIWCVSTLGFGTLLASQGPSLSVNPAAITEPYFFGLLGEREAIIIFSNDSSEEILCSKECFIEVVFPPNRRIYKLQPDIIPLVLPPREAIAVRWPISRPWPKTTATKQGNQVLIRVWYSAASSPENMRTVSLLVSFRSPPPLFMFLRLNTCRVLVTFVISWVFLDIWRFSRVTSFAGKEPVTVFGGALLGAYSAVCFLLCRLPMSTLRKTQLVIPSVTLVKWRRRQGHSPVLLLNTLHRCDALLTQLGTVELSPAHLLFQIQWLCAECVDDMASQVGRLEQYTQFASLMAYHYERAACYAHQRELESLCRALAAFYILAQRHFAGEGTVVDTSPFSGTPGAVASVWWATEILRVNIEEGLEGVHARLVEMPGDIATVPLLSWARGSATSWPSPCRVASRPQTLTELRLDVAMQKAEVYYRAGIIAKGMQVLARALGLERRETSVAALQNLIEEPALHRPLFTLARLTGQYLRFMRTLPCTEGEAAENRRIGRAWIAILDRVARIAAPNIEGASLVDAASLAGEFFTTLGEYGEALKCVEMVDRLRIFRDPDCLRAWAIAQKVRAEVYAALGSPDRAEPLLCEAGTWFAYLGEWGSWFSVVAMRQSAKVAQWERIARGESDVRAAIAETYRLAESAAVVLPARGYSLLFKEWALWGELVLTAPGADVEKLRILNDDIHAIGAEFQFPAWLAWTMNLSRVCNRIIHVRVPSRVGIFVVGASLNYFFWLARRQHHTNLVLSSFYYSASLLRADHLHLGFLVQMMVRLNMRKSVQLVANARLNVTESLRYATHAQMLLSEPQRSSAADTTRGIEMAISAVKALASESQEAPSDFLRRTSTIQRASVLTQFIKALSAGESVLGRPTFEEIVDRAYRTLQALRGADWNALADQRLVGRTLPLSSRTQELQKLHRELTGLEVRLLNGETLTDESAVLDADLSLLLPRIPSLRDLGGVEVALSRVRLELEEAIKREIELHSKPMAVRAEIHPLDAHLCVPDDAVVLEYVLTPQAACAFVIERNRPIRFFELRSIRIPDLSEIYGRILATLRSAGVTKGTASHNSSDLTEWEASLQAISEAIWPERLRAALCGYHNVYIVPWGELWNVPFAALPGLNDEPIVLEKTVSLLPSIQFLNGQRSNSGQITSGDVCIIAYDASSGGESQLSLGPEVGALSKQLPDAAVFFGSEATPKTLLAAAERFRWLHVACHGFTERVTPMFSRFALSPENVGDDGFLYLHQLQQRSSTLYGVFLNACESNLGQAVGDRADTLAAGFMSIGAQCVIGTLGAVCDDIAVDVALEFYRHIRHMRPDLALCLALRSLATLDESVVIEGSQIPKRHPLAWWPFVCINKG